MELIFVLLTQLINCTTSNIDFEDDRSRRLLRLEPGRAQFVKQSRFFRRIKRDSDWKIRVLLDGEFTGIELDPLVVLENVRLEFRLDNNVLCVDGVQEELPSDILLRHRYFGCMRKFYWNSRKAEPIDRSDSTLAVKLRYAASRQKESPRKNHKNIKEDKIELEGNGNKSRPQPPNGTATTQQATRLRGGDESSTTNVVGYAASRQKESPRKNHKNIKEDKIELEGNGNKSRPQPPNGTATTRQATRLRGGDESSTTTNVDGDSFVRGILIAFCFMVFILIKFLL